MVRTSIVEYADNMSFEQKSKHLSIIHEKYNGILCDDCFCITSSKIEDNIFKQPTLTLPASAKKDFRIVALKKMSVSLSNDNRIEQFISHRNCKCLFCLYKDKCKFNTFQWWNLMIKNALWCKRPVLFDWGPVFAKYHIDHDMYELSYLLTIDKIEFLITYNQNSNEFKEEPPIGIIENAIIEKSETMIAHGLSSLMTKNGYKFIRAKICGNIV